MIEAQEINGDLIFAARVVPKSSKSEIVGEHGGALKVRLNAPPIDGAANAELIKLLAKVFGVPPTSVEIVAGHASKSKKVKIVGGKIGILQSL